MVDISNRLNEIIRMQECSSVYALLLLEREGDNYDESVQSDVSRISKSLYSAERN